MRCCASIWPETRTPGQLLIVQEACGIELCSLSTEDGRVEVHLSVRHEEVATGTQLFAADGAGHDDGVISHRPVGEAQRFFVQGVQERPGGWGEEVVEVEGEGSPSSDIIYPLVGRKDRGNFGADGREKVGVAEEVSKKPEGESISVSVYADDGKL